MNIVMRCHLVGGWGVTCLGGGHLARVGSPGGEDAPGVVTSVTPRDLSIEDNWSANAKIYHLLPTCFFYIIGDYEDKVVSHIA